MVCRAIVGGDCRRTFNALTGTPLARLRYKERWLTQGAALQDGISVRKAATACGVAVSTAFFAGGNRCTLLRAAKSNQPFNLSGIVEADETFFRRSYKGSRQWKLKRPDRTGAQAAPSRDAIGQSVAHRSTRRCRCLLCATAIATPAMPSCPT